MDKIRLTLNDRIDDGPAQVFMEMQVIKDEGLRLDVTAHGGWTTPEEFGTFLMQLGADLGGVAPHLEGEDYEHTSLKEADLSVAPAPQHIPFAPKPRGGDR